MANFQFYRNVIAARGTGLDATPFVFQVDVGGQPYARTIRDVGGVWLTTASGQTIFSANTARVGFEFQNTTTGNVAFLGFGTAVALNSGSFTRVNAMGTYSDKIPGSVFQGKITIYYDTNSSSFSAYEWT